MKNKCRNKEYKHFIFILLHSLNSKFKLYKRWIIQLTIKTYSSRSCLVKRKRTQHNPRIHKQLPLRCPGLNKIARMWLSNYL